MNYQLLEGNTPSGSLYNAIVQSTQGSDSFVNQWANVFSETDENYEHKPYIIRSHMIQRIMDYIDTHRTIHTELNDQIILSEKIEPFLDMIYNHSNISGQTFGEQPQCRETLFQLYQFAKREEYNAPSIPCESLLADLTEFRAVVIQANGIPEVERNNLLTDIDRLISKLKRLRFYSYIEIRSDLQTIALQSFPYGVDIAQKLWEDMKQFNHIHFYMGYGYSAILETVPDICESATKLLALPPIGS